MEARQIFPVLLYNGMGNDDDDLRDVISQLSLTDYIHFLFLNTMQRKASADEIAGLIAIYRWTVFTGNGYRR